MVGTEDALVLEREPPIHRRVDISNDLFYKLWIFRIVNVLLINTYFDPDETYQSLEVAHLKVFGYGYSTWEWKVGIRSSLNIWLFAILYKLIQLFGLSDTYLFLVLPKILQAYFAALADFYSVKLANQIFGFETASWTVFCVTVNWFSFYCLGRTYSNSLEASLTMVGLYFWPSKRLPISTRRELRIALAVGAIACIIRPTSLLTWAYLGTLLLLEYPGNAYKILMDVIATGTFALLVSLYLDYSFYKRLVFPPLYYWLTREFFRVNVVEKVSEFYGTHPFHWYFTQGIPTVVGTFLPLTIFGMYNSTTTNNKALISMLAAVISSLSFQPHKEFRFLLPFVGPMLIYAANSLWLLEKKDQTACLTGKRSILNRVLLFLFISNCGAAYFFTRVHKRGVIDVVKYLRKEGYQNKVQSVIFLMPCHSTPLYSHIHLNIPMRIITCEPPLGIKDRKGYLDETGLLYRNPEKFISKYFDRQVGNKTLSPLPHVKFNGWTPKYTWPSHLVWYDNEMLKPVLQKLLLGSNYRTVFEN